MEITNKTLYNKELVLSYNNHFLKSYVKKNILIISIISVSFIVYMLVNKYWGYAGMLAGILVLYFVLTYFMQKITTKRMLKRSKLVENPVLQTYVFKDKEFDVENTAKYRVPYENVIKAKEAKDFYLLQTSDRKTFLITYAGFESEADRETIGDFFAERFNMKRKAPKK